MRYLITLLLLTTPLFAQTMDVTLEWDDDQAGVSYNIYSSTRSMGGDPTTGTLSASGITSTSTEITLPLRSNYFFVATAVNIQSGRESLPSNQVSINLRRPTSPTALGIRRVTIHE